MNAQEVLQDLIKRCNVTLDGTQQITFMSEQVGTQASKDYINGARWATEVFRKQLVKMEHELDMTAK